VARRCEHCLAALLTRERSEDAEAGRRRKQWGSVQSRKGCMWPAESALGRGPCRCLTCGALRR
jgi:hypothetical protein